MKCEPKKIRNHTITRFVVSNRTYPFINMITSEFQQSLGTSGMVFPTLEMVYKKLADIDPDPNSSAQALTSILLKLNCCVCVCVCLCVCPDCIKEMKE